VPRWRPCRVSGKSWAPQYADPSPLVGQGEDIVCATGNGGSTCDVGSSHPGAEAGPKGWAVRPLKRYASWVQNVVRQFGPYLPCALES
jgi:choline dehydrogenase-like flavoprotein